MNFLIFTNFYNKSGSEQVIQQYIDGIKLERQKILVVTCDTSEESNDIFKLNLIGGLKYRSLVFNKWYGYINKLILILFRKSISGLFFETSLVELNKKALNSFIPDKIIVFTGGVYEVFLFSLAEKIARRFNIPYIIHSCDPIPGMLEWGEKEVVRRAKIKMLKPYFKKASYVSAISSRMSDYFKKNFELKDNQIRTIYLPIKYLGYSSCKVEKLSFLYLGSIYGKRNPIPLFSALNQLFKHQKDIELTLAGTGLNKIDLEKSYPNLKNKLNVISYTNKPDQLIQQSSVLLDLNADIPGDVFISSKLMNYLGSDKPILVIGNAESASYDFSSKFSGVHFSVNNEKVILETLNSILITVNQLFERESEVEAYEVSRLSKKFTQ